jgi:hypothetical protein
MQAKQYTTVDKSAWPEGPWTSEPDKMQWQDEATKFPCLIVRNRGGALCGYVGVSDGHRYFGVSYGDLDEDIRVHGGLTFSNFCSPVESEQEGICHLPDAGEPNHVFWFGFDCSHAWDVSPAYLRILEGLSSYGEYRDVEYVKNQCAQLAAQLAIAFP